MRILTQFERRNKMFKWNYMEYRSILEKIKKRNELFLGQQVTSKDDIYHVLADKLSYSFHTVKSWTRPRSNGPTPEALENLENLLEIKFKGLSEKSTEKKEEIYMKTLPNISHQALFEIYNLVKDYFRDEQMQEEDCFAQLWGNLDRYKIILPASIHKTIMDYIDTNIAPIIYEPEKTYPDCFTEKCGHHDKERNTFVIDDIEEITKRFILTTIKLEEEFDQFFLETLTPHIL